MKTLHVSLTVTLTMILCASIGTYAQDGLNKSTSAATMPVAITAASTPLELARAAFLAQGGEKFKNLKNMVLIGSVSIYPPNSVQSIPGQFVIVTDGVRMRLDINATPILIFKQIFDGQDTYSSIPNVPPLPPPGKFGLSLLAKFDQPGYTVTAPDKKKEPGFRITDAEGNATDFYIDPVTARVSTYLSNFNGTTFSTQNKKMKDVDGVLVSYSFTQRLVIGRDAMFAEYNVKDVKLNQKLGDDVFTIPR